MENDQHYQMDEEGFKDKMEEWQSYLEGDEEELEHIEKPGLKHLYGALLYDPEGVILIGNYILPKSSDPLAVLYAMRTAAIGIVDADGEDSSCAEELNIINEKINDLIKEGKTSSIYEIWKEKYDQKYSDLSDEIAGD